MRASDFDPDYKGDVNEVVQPLVRLAGKGIAGAARGVGQSRAEKKAINQRNKKLALALSPQGGQKAFNNWFDAIRKDWLQYGRATRTAANFEGLSRFVMDNYDEMSVNTGTIPNILKTYAQGVNFPVPDPQNPDDRAVFNGAQIKSFLQAFARYFISNKRIRFAAAQFHPHTQQYIDELADSRWLDTTRRGGASAAGGQPGGAGSAGGGAGGGTGAGGGASSPPDAQHVLNGLSLTDASFTPLRNMVINNNNDAPTVLANILRVSQDYRDRFLTYFIMRKLYENDDTSLGVGNTLTDPETILSTLGIDRSHIRELWRAGRAAPSDVATLLSNVRSLLDENKRAAALTFFALAYLPSTTGAP